MDLRNRHYSGAPKLPQRTLDYITCGASEGQRNAELFDAACQFRDALFCQSDAESQLIHRAVCDGLSEAEAHSTIRSAYSKPPREAIDHNGNGCSIHPLTSPVGNGFIRFVKVCFKQGEYIAIAPARKGEKGEIFPSKGVTQTREEWIEKVEEKGGIEKCFQTPFGLFVRINPMMRDGSKDAHVTVYRHVLVEFDTDDHKNLIPKEKQFEAITQSKLPVAVVIDSGNKSLHAWVRVDASNAEEYKRRVEIIWRYFENQFLDKKNKNPSRLSRCPDGRRTVNGEIRSQRLLATNLGLKSWDEWETAQTEKEIGEPLSILSLSSYNTKDDPNNIMGNRWLCKGGSLVIIGQSGIGKSSFCMQLILLWALGLLAFHIKPVKPLRSLLIQAENDIGDLAEMYQGVKNAMGISAEQEKLLEDRVIIYRDTIHSGVDFIKLAERLIDKHKPDLVWGDPLLNYIGDDISEQKVVSNFCCAGLNPISVRTGVIWCLLHHTGKPSKDPKAADHWTASDLAYSGLGSSALVNWSRETAVLVRIKTPDGAPPTFQLSMTKRRKRAGLLSLQGEPTDTIFLRHSTTGGICWEQCEKPTETPKCRDRIGKPSAFDPQTFRAVLAEFGGKLTRENCERVAIKMSVSDSTIWRWWRKFKESGL
ncbi:MAG: AAA family ATPase [bacterium]